MRGLRGLRWGEIAHVFVGAALALPPLALGWVFANTLLRQPPGALVWRLVVALAVATVVAITLVATSPPVRPTEIAAARVLLGLDLPDPVVTRARGPRLLGAAWWLVVSLVGVVAALAVLILVPTGLGFVGFPFSGDADMIVPGRLGIWHVGAGWASWCLVPAGAVLLAAGLAAIPAAGRLTSRLAPSFLGPSDADLLAASTARERALARSQHLARELHDSIGHALTAITAQADAAERLAPRDPDAAARAARAASSVARSALDDLDGVLGALRRGLTDDGVPTAAPGLDDVLAAAARQLRLRVDRSGDLPPALEPVIARLAREALTNATRYGRGSAHLILRSDAAGVRLVVANELGPDPGRPGHEGGLRGLRERVLLEGGSLSAGLAGDRWVVAVDLPAVADPSADAVSNASADAGPDRPPSGSPPSSPAPTDPPETGSIPSTPRSPA